jgi:hypothetical protein
MRGGKANKTGRTPHGPSFTQLFHYMTDSPAWRSLTPAESRVYFELARIYNGANNGRLGFSVRSAADRCNISKTTAVRCFQTLQQRGFIYCQTEGGFSRKTRHAAEWRLNCFRCDVTAALPSKEFMKWRPDPEAVKLGTNLGSTLYQNKDTREAICA